VAQFYFNFDSCCSLLVMASILAKGTTSAASNSAALPTLPEELSCLLNRSNQKINISYEEKFWRALIEIGFIIFLFYSNLSMGEFERSGMGQKRGVAGQSAMSLRLPILKLPR
jgi:hypothetical protein